MMTRRTPDSPVEEIFVVRTSKIIDLESRRRQGNVVICVDE
jgi:hypothetical protein